MATPVPEEPTTPSKPRSKAARLVDEPQKVVEEVSAVTMNGPASGGPAPVKENIFLFWPNLIGESAPALRPRKSSIAGTEMLGAPPQRRPSQSKLLDNVD